MTNQADRRQAPARCGADCGTRRAPTIKISDATISVPIAMVRVVACATAPMIGGPSMKPTYPMELTDAIAAARLTPGTRVAAL